MGVGLPAMTIGTLLMNLIAGSLNNDEEVFIQIGRGGEKQRPVVLAWHDGYVVIESR